MNRQTFDRIYPKELTPKQNEVLELFLQRETDEDIAYKIDATHRTTTCKHLRNISQKFGFPPETQPDYRYNLVELFAKYKPELIAARVLERWGHSLPNLRFPEGLEPLNSPFYIERLNVESNRYKTLQQPGSLIRIKAPKQMGKTSLV